MRLREIAEKLGLKVICCGNKLDREVGGGYASDLLSNVIAHSKQGDVWVTIQSHANIVAVAMLKELSAIVITQGKEPSAETVEKASRENVPLLLSKDSTFYIVGKLYEMGITPIN